MAAEKTCAIVIRTVPFGETSSVVCLYCREFGKVRALAKGAWRPKSSFDGGLDLLSICQVLLLRKTSGGLDLVTEACLEHRFRVGTSLAALAGGMHVAELLEALTADADPQPELFDAAHATLRALSASAEPDALVAARLLWAELTFLRIAGLAPAVAACASCHASLPTTGRVAFGMLDGGGLCSRCRVGRRTVISVSAAALAALRAHVGPRPPAADAPLDPASAGEVRAVMNSYLAHALERPLVAARWLPFQAARRPARGSGRLGMLMLIVLTAATTGCATFKTPTWPWAKETPVAGADDDSTVISSEYAAPEQEFGWDYFKGENVKKRWKKMVGRGPNEPVARAALAEADALFREGKYKEAIKKYKITIDRWPDSVIEEDALWQLAECLFFTDQYPKAEDCYDELVKKYANTKYLDRIAQRQFVIAQYWIALDQKSPLPVIVPNLFDRSRPLFDTQGRALKAYDHVRINDPRGPLADDSIMAQANAHFLDRQWLDADYFYGLLRSEYPDSDFLLQAHMLGLQAKIRAYQGPAYEGGILDEAEILADQTLVQFPDQLSREDETRLEETRAQIAAQQAQRHYNRAEFYAKGKHYNSARIYYALVARDYPKTMLAAQAREKYAVIKDKADVSDDPFPMLTRVLNPDSLKEAELDAMAEAETAIARGENSGGSPPVY